MFTTTSVLVTPTTRPLMSSPSVICTNVFSYTLSYFSFSSLLYAVTFRLSIVQSKSSCGVGAGHFLPFPFSAGAFVVAVVASVAVADSWPSAFEFTIWFSSIKINIPEGFNSGLQKYGKKCENLQMCPAFGGMQN